MTIDTSKNTLFQTLAGNAWKKIGVDSQHGFVVPLFSLHTKNSCGIGEYSDLLVLLPWMKENKFSVLQLLPLNDTGNDSSPYSAISASALNPIHLGLFKLPYIDESPLLLSLLNELQSLNQAQRVPYDDVRKGKDHFLRNYYTLYLKNFASLVAYQEFQEKNAIWLRPYSQFKALKILRQWSCWESWQESSEELLKSPSNEILAEANYHLFIQFLCFQQFSEVTETAVKNEIFLMGDIPILINRESADVWHHPQFFQLAYSAGAPPDMYSQEGQKWGFPIYNWEALAKDNDEWWKNRIKTASSYYHLYRIDHIVGFYRIWAIPVQNSAKQGSFIPSDESLWISSGETILKMMIESSSSLPIGEDLGTIPPEVRISLKRLGICGTKVMRWERRWNEDKGFIDPKDYPCESLTTVSTHDSETLQLWWMNQPNEAQDYAHSMGWEYTPHLSDEYRLEILKRCHHSNSIFHVNLLQEYLALIPNMTWENPLDERINLPGIVSEFNWSYKFKPSLEEIVKNNTLKILLSTLLS